MKRDLDLIRNILIACEAHDHGYAPQELAFEGYSEEQVGWHIFLAGDAGLSSESKVGELTAVGAA